MASCGELAELLEALQALREENAALRHNFDALVDVHERAQRKAAAAAAEAEHAALARAVEHAAAITRLHEELVAANVAATANSRLRAEAQHPDGAGSPGTQQQGVRELGLALGAAHAACAALLEENGGLRRENETLRGALHDGAAAAAMQRVTRDAEVQHAQPAAQTAAFEVAAAELVSQLRADVAQWRAEAEARSPASSAGGEARREAAERRPVAPEQRSWSYGAGVSVPGPRLNELTAVPEADELTALARFYSRR
jgi:regulator of replication initiation timing